MDKLQKAPENENWQERFESVPSTLLLKLLFSDEMLDFLSEEEYRRMLPKLGLVEEAAQLLTRAMIKGTLKYPRDDWDVQLWEDHGLDDLVDVLNYKLLERAARRAND